VRHYEKEKRKHSPEFKAKVALEALQGIKTLSEIAQQYEIHPVMIDVDFLFEVSRYYDQYGW